MAPALLRFPATVPNCYGYAMPVYDFVLSVREELEQLERELSKPEVRKGLKRVSQRLASAEDVTVAALWRASKRHGETLSVFITELDQQFERETAAASGAAPAVTTGSVGEARH